MADLLKIALRSDRADCHEDLRDALVCRERGLKGGSRAGGLLGVHRDVELRYGQAFAKTGAPMLRLDIHPS